MERKRNHITAGAWILTAGIALLALAAPAVQAGEREYDESRAAKLDGVVYIENVAGEITVEGWDQPLVHVTGILGEEVEEVEFKVSGKKTRIEVEYPRRVKTMDRGAELLVRVPKGSRVEVECVSAPITVSGVGGRIFASSISGDVEIDGGSDEVEAKTISGNVEVASPADEINVGSISGRVLARGEVAEVRASVVNGRIVLEFERFLDLSVEAVNGSARVEGDLDEDADCSFDVHSGDVVLVVPADVGADFSIDTFNGDIDTDFGEKPRRTSKYAPGKELEFSVGGGGARVRINTFSGSVEIRKK